jgi:hypothetical protein
MANLLGLYAIKIRNKTLCDIFYHRGLKGKTPDIGQIKQLAGVGGSRNYG